MVNLNNNVISASDSGNSGAAIGISIAGDNNQVNITQSTIQATAAGVNTNALGIAANTGYSYYGSATDNTITLSSDSILTTSAFGSAIGIFDNQKTANHNTWNISADNSIQATGLIKSCSFYFNGVCTP